MSFLRPNPLWYNQNRKVFPLAFYLLYQVLKCLRQLILEGQVALSQLLSATSYRSENILDAQV